VILVFGGRITVDWLYLIPGLAAWFLFGFSVACLSGVVNTAVRDVQYIQSVAVQALFYATPIMFEARLLVEHGLKPLLTWNPLYPLLVVVQVPLLYGDRPPADHYLAVLMTLVLTVGLALGALRVVQRKLVFWL